MIIFNEQKNQLCNRLFAFLPSIAYAIENDEKMLVLFFSKKYLALFPNLQQHRLITFALCCDGIYPKKPQQLLYFVVKIIGRMVTFRRKNFSFINLSNNKNRLLFVKGWKERHAPSYIDKHYEAIKTIFKPNHQVQSLVDEAFSKVNRSVIIGVHIRRGDYKTYKNGIYYYDDEVYARVMNELEGFFTSQGKTVTFFLCSNEPIGDKLSRNYNVIDLGTNDFIADLYALSCTDYLIGPPSTFSQWASFTGKVPLKFIENKFDKIEIADFSVVSRILS